MANQDKSMRDNDGTFMINTGEEDDSTSPNNCNPGDVACRNVRTGNTGQAGIFERSLSFSSYVNSYAETPLMSTCNSINNLRCTRQGSIVSTSSQKSFASHHNAEDFIPPVLDHTTEILTDPSIDLNDVNVVCCDCSCDAVEERGKDQHKQKQKTGPHRTYPQSRSRSRSLVCNSLLAALVPNREDKEPDDGENEGDDSTIDDIIDSNTINFYSFNDVLHREMDLEKFNTFRMSKLLHQTDSNGHDQVL